MLLPATLSKLEVPSKTIIIIWACVALLLFAPDTKAQDAWSFTIKSGINIPTEEIVQAELKTGYAIEGVISYEVTNYLSANRYRQYICWPWRR